jgi:hypothetical protein
MRSLQLLQNRAMRIILRKGRRTQINLADHILNTVFGHSCVFWRFYICEGQWLTFLMMSAWPAGLSSTISEKYETSTLVFTDGSKSGDGTGFGVYVLGVRQVGYRLQEPSSVLTAEISAPGEYLILSDSLRSYSPKKYLQGGILL